MSKIALGTNGKKYLSPTIIERGKKELKKNSGLYILVAIPLAYLIIFKYIPIYGIQIAFRDYTPARTFLTSRWVGLKHFIRFFNNYRFWLIIRNTLCINLYSIMTFPLPIILALLLNYMPSKKFKKIVQMISYAPHFISTVVMAGIILQFLDTRNGPLNIMITALGGKAIGFIGRPEYFYHIYIWSGVWQNLGYSSIIYIASLAGVPIELHEAAIVDGANIIKRIWHIDLPSIMPTISILLIMSCGRILSIGYEKIFLLQNNLNINTSEVISTYVYKQGIAAEVPQYSYGSAIGLFISIVNLILLIIVNKISSKLSSNSLW